MPSTPIPHVGLVLSERWKVGPRIGTGGMASVHAGEDLRLTRPVAVKILHPHIAESADARERLAREARAIAQLKHENVIEVYDYDIEDPHCTWLIIELIEGYSLKQFLDRHDTPPPEVAVMIATEVVRALKAAHDVGVIHRDVKPDNILIGKAKGRPKLSDFGIAKVVSESRMTVTGNLVGSPSYMSPEQADAKEIDHRTDLYSVGILLYRMVTGTLPFRGQTPIDTIRRVSIGEYVDAMELSPNCPASVAAIIRRALTLDLHERYQSAEELLVDLGRVLQDAGLTATWEELPKYFADPTAYFQELAPRLARDLEARGKALLEAGEETRAVDCFNRAIALGEGSQNTVDLVRELSRRRNAGRFRKAVGIAGLAIGGIVGITSVIVVADLLRDEQPPPAAIAAEPKPAPTVKPEPKLAPTIAPTPKAEPEPAAVAAPTPTKVRSKRKTARKIRKRKSAAAPEPKSEPLYGTLHVGTKKWADVYVDGKRLGRAPERTQFPLTPGKHRLRAEQPGSGCLPFERNFEIDPGKTTRIRIKVVCP